MLWNWRLSFVAVAACTVLLHQLPHGKDHHLSVWAFAFRLSSSPPSLSTSSSARSSEGFLGIRTTSTWTKSWRSRRPSACGSGGSRCRLFSVIATGEHWLPPRQEPLSPQPCAVQDNRPSLSPPYAEDVQSNDVVPSSETNDSDYLDFKCKMGFFFPGQGAQFVGMAKETVAKCATAKELFKRASAVLGYDLEKLCVEGPKEELDRTAVCQPAILVASLAAAELLQYEREDSSASSRSRGAAERTETAGVDSEDQPGLPSPDVCMGLSLGEYTALCYSGAIGFEDAVRVASERGKAMQKAAEANPGGMVSIIGMKAEDVEDICARVQKRDGEFVQLANYLCPGNYVVSGSLAGCSAVEQLAKDSKARMTVRLAVEGAFHTPYMQTAVDRLRQVLETVDIRRPSIPVVSNVDAKPHSNPEVIKALLQKQVTVPVQWEKSVKDVIRRGLKSGYELGPGNVLAGTFKRMDKSKSIESLQ